MAMTEAGEEHRWLPFRRVAGRRVIQLEQSRLGEGTAFWRLQTPGTVTTKSRPRPQHRKDQRCDHRVGDRLDKMARDSGPEPDGLRHHRGHGHHKGGNENKSEHIYIGRPTVVDEAGQKSHAEGYSQEV